MTARIETTARATSIPMVVPQALPITSRGLQKLLKTARTRVTVSYTHLTLPTTF